jgi:hypothetical protein
LPFYNASKQMVISHCIDVEDLSQAKVVFPFEDWLFCCPPLSRIDIWRYGLTGAERLDSTHAEDLLLPAEVMAIGGVLTQESPYASAFF